MDDHHFSSITKLKNQGEKMVRGKTQKKQLILDFILFQNREVGRCTSDPSQEDREQSQFFFQEPCYNLATS
jgi:hypothetical protein